MDGNRELRALLRASSDPENPPAAELEELFERVRRIAVVGLSRDPAKVARRVPSYLAAKGYEVLAVNPRADRILGRPAYPTVSAVPAPVDLVVIFRPTGQAGPFVEEASRRPDRPAIWLQQGIRADEEVRDARDRGLTVVQDLCSYRVHRTIYA